MILPSRLPRRKSTTPPPDTDGAGAIHDAIHAFIDAPEDIQLNDKDIASILDKMELQYPDDADDRPPIYLLTEYGWRVPTRAEALAMTIPFQDPVDPPRVQFGMGLRDSNGQISPYVRAANDDIGVAPSDVLLVKPKPLKPDTTEVGPASHERSMSSHLPSPKKTPTRRKVSRRIRSPSPYAQPGPSETSPRKRKAAGSSTSSALSTSTKTRSHRTSEINTDLSSIIESKYELQHSRNTSYGEPEDDQATLIGSSPEKSPPRKIRPPNSGGSSPLKPKSASTFAGYQCQMPGCGFTASSPQHIKHHYQSFQHGRVTRQLATRSRMDE